MSAYMARILMWFFDINSSMRNGDTIGLVYKQVDGEEHFRILKLAYKSQHFSETFEANFYRKTGNLHGAYFDRAGKEIARRIETAVKVLGPSRVQWVHPDCGFWMLHRTVSDRKMQSLVAGRDLAVGSKQ